MAPAGANHPPSVQRSVLVLVLALTVVLFLTALIFEHPPVNGEPAAVEPSPQAYAQEAERTKERYLIFGKEYWRSGNYAKAEEALRMALLHRRRDPEVLLFLGMTVFNQGRFAESEMLFRQLVRLQPDRANGYVNLAVALMCQNKTEDASAFVDSGFALPDGDKSGPLHFIRAVIDARDGRTKRAEDHLRQAHQLLGTNLKGFAQAQWAEPIHELPAFREIIGDAVDDGSAPPPNIMPPASE